MPLPDRTLRNLGNAIALLALTGLMTYGCQKSRTQQAAVGTPPPPPAAQAPAPAPVKPAEPTKPVEAAKEPTKPGDQTQAEKPKPPIPHDELARDAKPLSERVTPSGIRVLEFKVGQGPPALPKARAVTHFVLYIQDGWKKIQSTYEQGEPEDNVIDDNLIMAEGLVGMKQGGMRRIIVPAERAFGSRGVQDKDGKDIIPPGAVLVYDVELVGLRQKIVTTPPAPTTPPESPKDDAPNK